MVFKCLLAMRLNLSEFDKFIHISLYQKDVPFLFIGTLESIHHAKLMLSYHLAHLKVSISLSLYLFIFVAIMNKFSAEASVAVVTSTYSTGWPLS